jgi:PPOX class F420-dependent enzyme/OxyR family protein
VSAFTDAEIAFLRGQRLGRIATVGRSGELHVVPARFRYDAELDAIDVTGKLMGRSKKYRDVQEDDRVAIVIDGSTETGAPCGIEVRGRAEAVPFGGEAITPGADPEFIRITPRRIVSWGIDTEPQRPHSRRVQRR